MYGKSVLLTGKNLCVYPLEMAKHSNGRPTKFGRHIYRNLEVVLMQKKTFFYSSWASSNQ